MKNLFKYILHYWQAVSTDSAYLIVQHVKSHSLSLLMPLWKVLVRKHLKTAL